MRGGCIFSVIFFVAAIVTFGLLINNFNTAVISATVLIIIGLIFAYKGQNKNAIAGVALWLIILFFILAGLLIYLMLNGWFN